MKRSKALLMATVLAVSSVAGTSAWADSRHHRGHAPWSGHQRHHHHNGGRALLFGTGLVVGSALWWAATRPPTVVVQEPAPVMVAPPPPVYYAPPAADGWWYYCRPSGTYYPYVGSCTRPWERVAPH